MISAARRFFSGRPANAPAKQSAKSQHLTELNQKHSPLLKLPPEIRNCIYEYAIVGDHVLVHLTVAQSRANEKLRFDHGVACGLEVGSATNLDTHQLAHSYYRQCGYLRAEPVLPSNAYALSMTCWQLHYETEYLVYAYNTIEVAHDMDIKGLTERFPLLTTSITHVHVPYMCMLMVGWVQEQRLGRSNPQRYCGLSIETFGQLKGLKKVTLRDDQRDHTAMDRLMPEMSLSTLWSQQWTDRNVMQGLEACIQDGHEVEVVVDRKYPLVEKFTLGRIMGGSTDPVLPSDSIGLLRVILPSFFSSREL
ncbi:hypothetical protein P171DRAFT_496855 [Karstenula rhodostoma CBS 690.94]|uniref:DUF7730 domain-containing protein n=1 Tax=Karstenula rhodostoma CBS 690.94 TaxID=1392251 RepID=A0A9P4PDG9_9PLEO|nr:hypothetical protein P171DRAFT_496855 [Karstenula rhodostoma CBS 690.94]